MSTRIDNFNKVDSDRKTAHPIQRKNSMASAKHEWNLFIAILVFSDLLLTFVAFWIAYSIRYLSDWPIFKNWIQPSIDYSHFSIMVIPVWIMIFAASGLYSRKNLLGGTREYALVFNATTLGLFVNIFAGFILPDNVLLARGWVILAWLLSFLLVATGRFILRRGVYSLRKIGFYQSSTLIVGDNSEAYLIAEQLINAKTAGLRVMGFVNCGDCQTDQIEGLSCLGNLEDLETIIQKNRISVLILISSALSQEQVISVFQKFGTSKEIDLRLTTGLYEIITTGLQVKEEGMVPLVVINKVRLTGADQVLKTILDYFIAIPAVIVLMPFFIIIAFAVKLDSPGPIIYLRRVMGVNGKQFNAYKFRTMCEDSDSILASDPALIGEYKNNFKLKEDPRITRLGKVLRKWSIDELPQLFNVLKSEMSLVGPRMICPEELEKYNQWGINLLTVKPGITGLWQVRGRSDLTYDERVRLDMYYVRNWTMWLDLQIIVQTIPSVIFRKGAY